ncbi:MAG: hypothetical protein ABI925_03130 [Verrucomicrobiota bacterium]
MKKIVYRRVDSGVKPDSVAAKPRTVYLSAAKYMRIEEPPDEAAKTQILKIAREPDFWLINLADHTAQHFLDPGPTFTARAPILWTPKPAGENDPDLQFAGLEFGTEEAFFRQNHGVEAGTRKIDGRECMAFTIKTDARDLTLFVDSATRKPVFLESTKGGKVDFAMHYDSYETNLHFDPALFQPPDGLKITEGK